MTRSENLSGSETPFMPFAPGDLGQEPANLALLEVLDRAAEYFALLSEPSRLRIIQAICYEERSVQQVVDQTGLPQPNVSRHLSLLHRSGVLSRRRSGTSVFYRVSDDLLTEVCRLVCVRLAGHFQS